MTGLECLYEEMARRGLNKAQIQSKVVPILLDILANSGTLYTNIEEAKKELDNLKSEIQRYYKLIIQYQTEYEELKKDINEARTNVRNLIDDEINKTKEYVDDFIEELKHCETEESRDCMKRAQVFVNSVSVDTKYDNTAYIISLGSILSNGDFGTIDALKQINPKLFIGDTFYDSKKNKFRRTGFNRI